MKSAPNILVVKASEEKEPYQRDKVVASLERTGVPPKLHPQALAYVEDRLYQGIKTREIFKHLKRFLKKSHRESASRYGLKQALLRLGPSGFPFEVFVGELFKRLGYQVSLNQIIKGKCVDHEVDVIAVKDTKHFVVECKYHHSQGVKTDVKVALYVWARFQDIVEEWQGDPKHHQEYHQSWVVTNTRCTSDAYQYGRCRKMRVISWDQPAGEGLRELVNQTGLHPITCLSTLPTKVTEALIKADIVDIQQFLKLDIQKLTQWPPEVLKRAKEEAKLLLD